MIGEASESRCLRTSARKRRPSRVALAREDDPSEGSAAVIIRLCTHGKRHALLGAEDRHGLGVHREPVLWIPDFARGELCDRRRAQRFGELDGAPFAELELDPRMYWLVSHPARASWSEIP